MEKLSNHAHSTRSLGELPFHKDVYMPGNLIGMCVEEYVKHSGEFRMTNSGKSKIGCDRGHSYALSDLERLANSIPDIGKRIFEVVANYHFDDANPYSIEKFVARIPYDVKNDISIVFLIENKPCILTAWINPRTDRHETLDPSKYIKSKKERQEITAKMKQRYLEQIGLCEDGIGEIVRKEILNEAGIES